jgi:hypothetical protein
MGLQGDKGVWGRMGAERPLLPRILPDPIILGYVYG